MRATSRMEYSSVIVVSLLADRTSARHRPGLPAPLALGLDVEAEVDVVAARAALEVDVGRCELAARDPAGLLERDPAGVIAAALVGGVQQRRALGGGAVGRVADP